MAKLQRILVANRGEIAVRVMRTLRERELTSIAIYSEPDREALHVLMADEAYAVGPGPARESYLHLERVLETARQVKADAIHPGYGFFAESAEFAAACEARGITFIGPSSGTIAQLGDKLQARAAAKRAKVPLVPASEGALDTPAAAREAAIALGYPIMLKAAAGGGGKGMRVVRNAGDLASAFDLARGEAQAAFGDARLYAEKWIERPRHIEAQILADDDQVMFLGERECSIQRRHQKLFEETPSPALDATSRAALGEAACRIAREVGYRSAGTVEFILDAEGRFYFLEVNTRLQVEHPVTEMVTGTDLVAEQLRVAAGQRLSFAEPPASRGWSMEARLIAEDPAAGFLPSVGRLERVRFPQGPGVRNDAGVYRGYSIPVHYDSLLAKLVVWGEDRDHARRRMGRALRETVLEGVRHNVAFHRWLVNHPEFAAGRLSTAFLETHFEPKLLTPDREAREIAVVAAALHAREERASVSLPDGESRRATWRWADRRGRPARPR
jgi:acetyl-CoA carboxylase biotin carboxylase subunit